MLETVRNGGWLYQQNFIAGKWLDAHNRETFSVTNPATGEIIGTVPFSGTGETRSAIIGASGAFRLWSTLTAAERAIFLHRIAALIKSNRDQLAAMLTLEQGKPLAEATAEIDSGAAYVTWFAEQARRINGDIIPSPWPGRSIFVTKEAVGVVAAITPWNFPFSMIARKLAAALAAGCTIVIKPSEFTPFSGLAWGRLASEAGLPAGVVNILTGDAEKIGDELSNNDDVRKLTFTGSTRVGKLLYRQSAGSMKRLSMELGGNAPFIVFDDADLDRAVKGAVLSKFRNSGQTCVCTNRFYVQDNVYEAFLEKFAVATTRLKVGNGFDPGVEQGPLINQVAVEKVESHIEEALAGGARIVCGGTRHAAGKAFFQPTILADVNDDMAVCRDETFGPVAPVSRFRTVEEAVSLANATHSGLAAYVYTRDLNRAFEVTHQLRFGMVGINEGLISTEVAPFGGVKESGIGREGSVHGLEDYLSLKYVCVAGGS